MTATTSILLGNKAARSNSQWHLRFARIRKRLVREYGVPNLGNYRDPVREIIYIVLSAKTTESLYQRANRRLWARFRTVGEIADAPQQEIIACIREAGLANKRAAQIQMISRRLAADFGARPSKRLRAFDAKGAFAYLTSLPGVGPKSALCVMMCSLGLDVFPVDANVHRVARRLGALRTGLKHYEAQTLLPRMIPCGMARDLHVTLLVHGREVCTPRSPLCNSCVINDHCRYWQKKEKVSK